MGDSLESPHRSEHQRVWETVEQSASEKPFNCTSNTCRTYLLRLVLNLCWWTNKYNLSGRRTPGEIPQYLDAYPPPPGSWVPGSRRRSLGDKNILNTCSRSPQRLLPRAGIEINDGPLVNAIWHCFLFEMRFDHM